MPMRSTSNLRRSPGDGRRQPGRFELSGAVAVVTGAGSGIGRSTAHALAQRGALVIAADLDLEAAEKTAADCGGVARGIDVADRDAMVRLANYINLEYGVVKVLVNNAGVGLTGRFLDTSAEDWNWILGINLLGVINGCQAFGPAMIEAGSGQVINVSSALGYFPRGSESAYITSKAAVIALSRCLRADWGRDGVGVSVVCPGLIDTAIVKSTRFRGARDDDKTMTNAERLWTRVGHSPELVADAIVGTTTHNRAVVSVGWESHVARAAHRVLPDRITDRLARATLGGI